MKWLTTLFFLTSVANGICLDFEIEISSELCGDEVRAAKINSTLSLIESIRLDKFLAPPFSQNILGAQMWPYLKERVTRLRLDETCRAGALAYVNGRKHDGILFVCPDFFDDRVSVYERAETLLHEARHFEGYRHVDCRRGLRRGELSNCDESIDELGSYAVTVEALTKMAAADIPLVDRAMNKISALVYADEAFNEPVRAAPDDLHAIYFEQNDGRAFIFDGSNSPHEVRSLWPARVISRGFSLAVFPADLSGTFRVDPFSPSLAPLQPTGWIAQSYNALALNERQPVHDILNLGYLTGYSMGHSVHARRADGWSEQVVRLEFLPRAIYSGAEVGRADTDSIYVVNAQDEMWRLRFKRGEEPTRERVDNLLVGLSNVMIFRGERLARDRFGRVLVEREGWTEYPPLRGRSLFAMTRPFIWDDYFRD